MQAIILAAGKSSRFEPFTSLSHKSLLSILGKPILEHTIIAIKKSGIDNVVVVVGEKSTIPEIIGSGDRFGLKITYVTHIGAKGGGAALLDAKQFLEERFFLINPNHVNFETFAKDMQNLQTTDQTVVLLTKKPTSSAFGVVEINGRKVTGVVEKPEKILDHQLQIIGIYLLNKTFLETLEVTPLEHYHLEKALNTYAQKNTVTFLKADKQTLSLKYSWDSLQIKDYLLSSIESYTASSAKISERAAILGKVYIEDGVQVMEGAVIKGPAYIGKNAVVGTDAILRNGVDVEADVVIGARMEVKNVLIGEKTTTHSGFLGDSIVGKSTKIAAYVCTANARLDRQPVSVVVKGEKISSGLRHLGTIVGDNVNIGIRVSLMPGVVIGEGSTIGPSTTVMRNVTPYTKYYTKFQEVVEDAK